MRRRRGDGQQQPREQRPGGRHELAAERVEGDAQGHHEARVEDPRQHHPRRIDRVREPGREHVSGREHPEHLAIEAPAPVQAHRRVQRPALVEQVDRVVREQGLEADARGSDQKNVQPRGCEQGLQERRVDSGARTSLVGDASELTGSRCGAAGRPARPACKSGRVRRGPTKRAGPPTDAGDARLKTVYPIAISGLSRFGEAHRWTTHETRAAGPGAAGSAAGSS